MSAAIVLCYHRVRAELDPLHLSVHPERFAAQLDRIATMADVVPASEIGRPGSGRPTVAITFDDGYADNLEAAAPALAARGLPATFFFTTAAVDGGADFWWERLDHLVLDVEPARPFLEVDLGGRVVQVDVRRPAGRLRAHRLLNDHLLGWPPDAQERLLGSVREQLGGEDAPCDAHRKITEPQVRELLAHDGFDLGGHTANHPVLARLDASAQAREVSENRARMAELAGRPVTLFAYPYGYPGSYDDVTVAAVRSAGYERAFTTSPGRADAAPDALRLPRHGVLDWNGDELGARLAEWLA